MDIFMKQAYEIQKEGESWQQDGYEVTRYAEKVIKQEQTLAGTYTVHPSTNYDACDPCYLVSNYLSGYGCGNSGIELVLEETIQARSVLPPLRTLNHVGRKKTKRMRSHQELPTVHSTVKTLLSKAPVVLSKALAVLSKPLAVLSNSASFEQDSASFEQDSSSFEHFSGLIKISLSFAQFFLLHDVWG
ncbi:hypothetical protein AC1031_011658 [Aphanomyces cochlioides]|nr:hypothetical protein AC1031_011658 [Aphanomyces cochlioides]